MMKVEERRGEDKPKQKEMRNMVSSNNEREERKQRNKEGMKASQIKADNR